MASAATSGAATPGSTEVEITNEAPNLPPPPDGLESQGGPGWKPFPQPKTTKPPLSVAAMITEGKKTRFVKKLLPQRPARTPPAPAVPRGTVPTDRDVRMSRRQWCLQARCLRRHNAVLSDRMQELAKPKRRGLIYMWRDHVETLKPEQIYTIRNMLDASDPFQPEQAYEYFINLKRAKKKADTSGRSNQAKKDLKALCGDRQFAWARNATIAFARGIQQRLSRPGSYQLQGGMLRLSNIILDEICSYSKTRPPSRRSSHPKARFLNEMADKIAVWIDEILSESEDRMLMMDNDEDDEEVEAVLAGKPLKRPSGTSSKPSTPGSGTSSKGAASPAGTVTPTGAATPPAGGTPTVTPATTPGATSAASSDAPKQ